MKYRSFLLFLGLSLSHSPLFAGSLYGQVGGSPIFASVEQGLNFFEGSSYQAEVGYTSGHWSAHVLFESINAEATLDERLTELAQTGFGFGLGYSYLGNFRAGLEFFVFDREFSNSQTAEFDGQAVKAFVQGHYFFSEHFYGLLKFRTVLTKSLEQRSNGSTGFDTSGQTLVFGLGARL